ncbi:sigma-54-dependent Fis family transcriptional regulator, partial [Phocaeicola vulgatus]
SEAEGGTLFLDEIGNLPLGVQQMLLCAIQDRRYRPVGGTKDRKANVRIITATNENLEEAISERRFRRDLYFRLSEYTVKVPPLRECPEDILPLAEFFRELYNQEHGRQVKGFDAEAKKRLLAHDWPGNVRELKQAVQSAVLFAQGELVTAEELNLDESGKPSDPDIALKGECMEKKRICQALEKAGHNRKEAARLLGISRSTLYEKMDLYGIQTKR